MAKKKIVLHIEIDVTTWGVDWKDQDERESELQGIQDDLLPAMIRAGIDPATVTIVKCEIQGK